jgi:hypothetical protein
VRVIPRVLSLALISTLIAPGLALAQEVRSLYAPLAAGQILDWHSTRTALARPGTQEANVLLKSCVRSDACFISVKSALTAGVITYMELTRKKHPKAAFWMTLGIAAGTTAVAVNNYRQGR